jgi:FKBP-type peptidyl-prolyl cis-trans isomerase 2
LALGIRHEIIERKCKARKEVMVVVEEGKTVSIEYTLFLEDGTEVDSNVGETPLVYEHGHHQILPALERALGGLKENDTKEVFLTVEEGYGPSDPKRFESLELEAIPQEGRRVGMILTARDRDGNEQPVRVHKIDDDEVILDFNHLLAGEKLHFSVRVLSVE